jgi:hypothetical protein
MDQSIQFSHAAQIIIHCHVPCPKAWDSDLYNA